MTYPGTNLPLAPGYPVDQLRSTLLAGPGATGLYSGAVSFLRMSKTLTTAAEDLDAVLGGLSEGLDGRAAAAARQHITALVENGRVGAAQATLAYNGLNDQGDHHVRARQDMQAVPAQPDPDQQHVFAVDSAARYQDNANHTLTDVFQPFVTPAASAINVAPAAAPHAAGWGSPAVGGAAHPGAGGVPGLPVAATPAGSAPTGPHPPGAVPGGPGATAVPAASPLQPGSPTPPTRAPNRSGPPTAGATPGGSRRATAPGAGRAPAATSPQRTPPGAGSPHLTGGPTDERASAPRSGLPGTGGPAAAPWTPTGPPSQSWRNSQPWATGGRGSGDPHPAGPGPGRSEPDRPAGPGRPGAPGTTTRSGPSGTGQGMAPMMGGGGRGQDSAHRRPPWLLLDDPQAFWLSGLPPHTPAVIDAATDDEPEPEPSNGR